VVEADEDRLEAKSKMIEKLRIAFLKKLKLLEDTDLKTIRKKLN